MRLAGIFIGIAFAALLINTTQAVSLPPLNTYSLTLEWDASPSPEVVGYHLYYGVASGSYTSNIAISNVTTVEVPELLSGVTYYFAITAVAANGQESGFSNEFGYVKNAPTQLQIQSRPGGLFMLSATGITGHTYDIEATEDLNTWTVIGTTTMGVGGSFSFTDTNAASYSKRFYRTRDTQP
jgi:hypothetical protein